MSDRLHVFEAGRAVAVALPFDLDAAIRDWASLRPAMARKVADGFTRDEWAYVISFLDAELLRAPFRDAFGEATAAPSRPPRLLLRPRGRTAVWLPSNVSLLGPLTTILLSLTGNPLRLKIASSGGDLTSAFLAFARANLPAGALRTWVEGVRLEQFDREDPRNRELAAEAMVRIVFGSDAAAAAIHALPHPVDSVGVSFADRRSEAWLDAAAADDATLAALVKVFAIYGQAGCTSPRRVVLLDGGAADARALRDRLAAAWPRAVRDVAMHLASANVMGRQWAAALGWDAVVTPRNGAVLACGRGLPEPDAPLFLPIDALPLDEAVASLPENVQTLGLAAATARGPRFGLELAARTGVKRVVPIARMHHFGAVWDGRAFWREAFEEVPVEA